MEAPDPGESPLEFVCRSAREKCADVSAAARDSMVIGADTIVTVDGLILGKPTDSADAARMLRALSGRQHAVYTAVCVVNQRTGKTADGVECTNVWFDLLDDAIIQDYLGRENVTDKAGAYAIQGYASVFIPRIEGDYLNVVGLPLSLTYKLICRTSS